MVKLQSLSFCYLLKNIKTFSFTFDKSLKYDNAAGRFYIYTLQCLQLKIQLDRETHPILTPKKICEAYSFFCIFFFKHMFQSEICAT